MLQEQGKVHLVPAGGGGSYWFSGCVWTYKGRAHGWRICLGGVARATR